jgi:predicted RNA-binding Zn-ribbon protein involved in translation (DUF1610 family)
MGARPDPITPAMQPWGEGYQQNIAVVPFSDFYHLRAHANKLRSLLVAFMLGIKIDTVREAKKAVGDYDTWTYNFDRPEAPQPIEPVPSLDPITPAMQLVKDMALRNEETLKSFETWADRISATFALIQEVEWAMHNLSSCYSGFSDVGEKYRIYKEHGKREFSVTVNGVTGSRTPFNTPREAAEIIERLTPVPTLATETIDQRAFTNDWSDIIKRLRELMPFEVAGKAIPLIDRLNEIRISQLQQMGRAVRPLTMRSERSPDGITDTRTVSLCLEDICYLEEHLRESRPEHGKDFWYFTIKGIINEYREQANRSPSAVPVPTAQPVMDQSPLTRLIVISERMSSALRVAASGKDITQDDIREFVKSRNEFKKWSLGYQFSTAKTPGDEYICVSIHVCPTCTVMGAMVWREQESKKFYLSCPTCGTQGPRRDSKSEAIDAWLNLSPSAAPVPPPQPEPPVPEH